MITRRTARTTFISITTFAMLLLSGCAINPPVIRSVRGSGVVKTEDRKVAGVTKVTLDVVGKLYIKREGEDALRITADDNILPLIRTNVRNGELTIGFDPGLNFSRMTDLTYSVSVKDLDALTVNGAADVIVSDLDSDNLVVTINGAGKVTVAGKADHQTVAINGAGEYSAPNLESRIAEITHSGLGKATVRVRDQLTVRIDGAGLVEYIGNPQVTKTINGLGSVQQSKP